MFSKVADRIPTDTPAAIMVPTGNSPVCKAARGEVRDLETGGLSGGGGDEKAMIYGIKRGVSVAEDEITWKWVAFADLRNLKLRAIL